MKLLRDDVLERSSVVVNCQMNRQRTLTGSNGYAKELRSNPLDVLLARARAKLRWLDLYCGEARRIVAKELRQAGLEYDSRRKLVHCSHRVEAQLPFRYCGADDQAGPNYTRQPAVDSYYDANVTLPQGSSCS